MVGYLTNEGLSRTITLALCFSSGYAMNIALWTFVSESGREVLRDWANRIGLPTLVRAQLDQKLDVLRQQPFDVVIHTHLLAPVGKQRHIYKLRVNGKVAARPMLCRGPLANESAYTLLVGAVERDGRLRIRLSVTAPW